MSLQFLLDSYDEWRREREDIADREARPGALVSSEDWHNSDDSAIDLMHQMAVELRKRMPEWWTVDEIAESMRVSKMTVYRLTASGELPAVKFGRSFRVSDTDFQEYLAKNTTGRP